MTNDHIAEPDSGYISRTGQYCVTCRHAIERTGGQWYHQGERIFMSQAERRRYEELSRQFGG